MIKKNNMQRLLEEAAPSAVNVLVEVLEDESLPRPLRVDVAKDVLNRAWGKTAPTEKEPLGTQTIKLCDTAKALSE